MTLPFGVGALRFAWPAALLGLLLVPLVFLRARHALAGYRAAVFDGFVPASAMNALYVAPPPGNAVCPTDGMADAAAVVDWEPEHPALSGFEGLQALRLGPVRRLATPAWGASIVQAAARGGDFPLLVAGEQRGRAEGLCLLLLELLLGGAQAALQVEVLADRVVKRSHDPGSVANVAVPCQGRARPRLYLAVPGL